MPIRASEVTYAPSFDGDMAVLRGNYPRIDEAIDSLCDVLRLDHELTQVGLPGMKNVYAILWDYPLAGAAGVQQFLVTYHATDPAPSWNDPYRKVTLLTITDRRPPSQTDGRGAH